MNCPIETQESAELLLAYCARKLDPESSAVLEAHISKCEECARFAAAQEAVWNALDTWEAAPVSPDFNRRLYQRIEAEANRSVWQRVERFFRPMLVRQGLPIAAAACLLVMAGMLLERPKDARAPEGAAQVEAVQPDQVDRTLEDMEMLREFHHIVRAEVQPNAM